MPPSRASTGFIYITIALDALAFGIMVPVEPDMVRKIGHVSQSQASFWMGALLAGYSAMQFLAAPLLGGLSDRFGRRPVLLASLAALGLSAAATPLMPNLLYLLAVRMAAGATAANSAAAQAYIADITKPEARTRRFGIVGALYGAAFVLGPAAGGALGSVNIALPFFAAATLAAANVLYGLFALPESLPPDRRRGWDWHRANPFGTLAALFKAPETRWLALAWCCSWFAFGAQQSSFILANEMRYGWNTLKNGMVLALAGTASALTQAFLVGTAEKLAGSKRTAVAGYSLLAAGYICYAFAARLPLFFTGLLLIALGALGNPAVQSMVSAEKDEKQQGEAQGALTSLEGLMASLSPIVMGSLFTLTTRGHAIHFPGSPFLLAAMVCAAAVIFLLRANRTKTE